MREQKYNITVHKCRSYSRPPKVSLILLDWSCRERFFALDWLSDQNVDRDDYEIIWVELFDRVVPEAMIKADTVITCGQAGRYHKHMGYNIGLLHAKGETITVCDSDAVFPPDFITSIKKKFGMDGAVPERSLVLMHYERRSRSTYPDRITDISELAQHDWAPLWENLGACVTVRRADAIRFGGFDEHKAYRGYICGPYDLAWRIVNAGIPEEWHEPDVTLWHFDHPNEDRTNIYRRIRWETFRELGFVRPHLKEHALPAVEALCTGRILPLNENQDVHALRMAYRTIGSSYELEYARLADGGGFSRLNTAFIRWLHFENLLLAFLHIRGGIIFKAYSNAARLLYSQQAKNRRLGILGAEGILCSSADLSENVLHDSPSDKKRQKMNILFLSDDDLTKSVVYDIHVMAEGLSTLGHNVCVVDCKRDKPRWFGVVEENMARVFPESKVCLYRYSMWTFPVFSESLRAFIVRFIYSYYHCYRIAKKVVKNESIDVVVSYSVIGSGLSAIKLSKKSNIPVVFRNIDMLHRLNASQFIRNAVAFFELIVYPRMDRIFALTPKYADYLTIMGAESAKLELLPFPVEVHEGSSSQVSNDENVRRVCEKWVQEDRRIIGFVGHFYTFSGLPELIREFPKVLDRCPEARLLLVGDGPKRSELERLVVELSLHEQVLITGLQPFETMPYFIGLSTLCINVYPIDGDMRDLFAAKVVQYLACGKPTVSSALPGMTSVVPGEGSGVVYVDDAAGMADEIVSLLQRPERRCALSKAALAYVRQVHARDEILRNLEGSLLAIIEAKSKSKVRGGLLRRTLARVRSKTYVNDHYDSANDGFKFGQAGQRLNRVVKDSKFRRVMLFMDKIGDPRGKGSCTVRRVSDDALVGVIGTIAITSLPLAPSEPRWVLFDTDEVCIPETGDYRVVFEWDRQNGDAENYPRVRFNNADTIGGCFTQFSQEGGWVDREKSDTSIHLVLER